MAVRTITSAVCFAFLGLLLSSQVFACFGPKLFVGAAKGAENEVLYALVTLYIQEKTGVESTPVDVVQGSDPRELIVEEKADLVFVQRQEAAEQIVFQITGLPVLVTGKRPVEDLQFTTVLPAIRKLNRILKFKDVENLASQVQDGQSAMSVAREFFMKNRLI